MKISCIAIDDEPLALDLIKDYSNRVPFLNLEKLFESGIEALDWLHHNTTQLIFLDIMMPEITGIQFIETLYNKPLVIFTTAYEDYALKGFELDAIDYLLKPITFDRFLKSTLKVREKIFQSKKMESGETKTPEEKTSEEEYIFIRSDGHLVRIDFESILFIEGMSDYLRIHTDHGKYMTLMNFQNMLSILPYKKFIRVHRSYIVNIKQIDTIESKHIILKGNNIPISRNYRSSLLDYLDNGNMIFKNKPETDE